MVLVSKPVDFSTTNSFSGGGRVVVADALVCGVGVSQGAEGARDTGMFGCGVRDCGGPAGVAITLGTGAHFSQLLRWPELSSQYNCQPVPM